ncbi:transcriptional regulator [Burkholderia pseudomallei]|uniref:transcriptional regulator n=1 Tax=Burkholderia pseudomallei TaxID=28450 RepID=UPI001E5EDC83|nr:YdaS family helix-turn-helix protein [Burkholderia pseudomallei]
MALAFFLERCYIFAMNLASYLAEQKLTQAAFAELLGVSQGLIYQWLTGRRPVAADKCVVIERATNGAVTRRDLRSDWSSIWPELIETDCQHKEARAI